MATYAILDDVKRILRASARERIRFPGNGFKTIDVTSRVDPSGAPLSYQQKNGNNVYKPTYNFLFNEVGLVISPSFKGRIFLSINFTSSTTYNVYHQPIINGQHDKRDMLYGSGNISTVFDYMGHVEITAASWGGTITAGDTVKIEIEVDISNEDAEFFIENAEIDIDNMLSANRVDYLNAGEQRLFQLPDVPPPIKMATQYLAAYYIYTAAYAEEQQDGGRGQHFSKEWKTKALSILSNYISYAIRLPPSAVDVSIDFSERALCLAKEWHNPCIIPCEDLTLYNHSQTTGKRDEEEY
jgi:hypothetical protein